MKKTFEIIKSDEADRDYDLVRNLTERQRIVIALNDSEVDLLINELKKLKEEK